MLYDLNVTLKTTVPHRKDYDRWMKKLSTVDYQAVIDALNDYCDKATESVTSSFIPGSIWDKPYIALYHACDGNETHAGFFFGLLLWNVIQDRTDEWILWRAEAGDGLTYFRKK